jgi:hypothetical protein
MESRDIRNYAPLLPTIPIILTFVQVSKSSIKFEFNAWPSTKSFENDEEPLPNFHDSFSIEGAQFDAVKASQKEMFASIDNRINELAEVVRGETEVTDWAIDARNRTFIINRENLVGHTQKPIIFSDGYKNGFTAEMQSEQNLPLRQSVGLFCLSFAAGVDRPNHRIYKVILESL